MAHRWFQFPKSLFLTPLMVVLLLTAACGGSAEPAATTAPASTGSDSSGSSDAMTAAATEAPTPTPTRGVIFKPTATPMTSGQAEAVPVPTEAPAAAPSDLIMGGVPPLHAYSAPDHWGTHRSGTLNQIMHSSPLYNNLVRFDPETEDRDDIIGDLAASWEITDGGLSYVFKIHEGVQWHDGMPVTSEDVAFSVDRWVEPDQPRPRTGNAKAYYDHGTVEVVDPLTVKVPLKFAAADFFSLIAADVFKVVPKHVAGEGIDVSKWDNIVGSGPYMVQKYDTDISTDYIKNPNYFKEGKPYLDGMEYLIVRDKGRIIAAFKTKQFAMASSTATHLSVDDRKQLVEDMGGELIAYGQPYGCNSFLMFNVKKEPYNDPRVRHAIFLAIHRQPIMDAIISGEGDYGTVFQPGAWFARTSEEAEQLPGIRELNGEKHPDDIAEAKRLLAEAGHTNGFQAVHSYRTFGSYGEQSAIVKDQLKEHLNIEWTLESFEPATGLIKYRDEAFNTAIQGHCYTANVPDSIISDHYRLGGTRNYTGFTDPKIEELFENQARESNSDARKAILRELEDYILTPELGTPSVLLMWSWGAPRLAHKSIKNLYGSPSVQAQMMHETIWWDQSEW